ncbi:M48 family metalloprotease [bacterium]|nr:M48 family metalloprotease [bacterium]
MLKVWIILVLLIFNSSFSYAQLKDANLIKINEIKRIHNFALKKKSHKDNKEYLKYQKFLSKEEYDLYLITDKLIRANNLQFKNRRIGFNIDKDTINVLGLNNNLVLINSSLYDCLHQNKDALTFAIAHEFAHFILNHQKETIENTYKIKKLQEDIEKLNTQKSSEIYSKNLKNLINNIYISQRTFELEADSLALELSIRAGCDIDNILEIFDYLSEDLNFYEGNNIYPLLYERKDNILAEYELLDVQHIKLEGIENLYSSEILTVQKSIDKETLILNKPNNYKNYSFKLTNKYQKFLSKAYSYYIKEDINNAILYFEKAYEYNPNCYIAPLYLSYCYEFQNNKKLAKKYIKKAKTLKPKDEKVLEQYKIFYKR